MYKKFIYTLILSQYVLYNHTKTRYGGERYEKRELQLRVRKRFQQLQQLDEQWKRVPWHIVDASQNIDQVQEDINKIVDHTLKQVSQGKPLERMFEEGVYLLNPVDSCPKDEIN